MNKNKKDKVIVDKNTIKCESNYNIEALKIKGIIFIGIISIIGIIILTGLYIIHNPECNCKNIIVNESQIKDSETKRLSNVKLYEIANEIFKNTSLPQNGWILTQNDKNDARSVKIQKISNGAVVVNQDIYWYKDEFKPFGSRTKPLSPQEEEDILFLQEQLNIDVTKYFNE